MENVDILVLDFGSQFTQLIVRRLRDMGFYAQLCPYFTKIEEIKKKQPKGIILSGGPASVYDKDAFFCDDGIYDLNIPILGICYGMQMLAYKHGIEVVRAQKKEYGKANLTVLKEHILFKNTPDKQIVWMSHADKVLGIPEKFEALALSENSEFSAFGSDEKQIYALQFHPEVVHSEFGSVMLKNFAKYICHCESTWNMGSFAKKQFEKIKQEVGDSKVLCAVSGGVDSSVVAALLSHCIKDNLLAVFVDTGLLRTREAEQVRDIFKNKLGVDLISIDASQIFLSKLKGITDPEEKRKIIGNTFIEIFEEEAKKHEDIKFLAQGTLYTDVIESLTVTKNVIKSHHNVGGLPEHMNLKLLEPLREIFKDEVRALGLELGLPKDLVYRHPFPGPGLAIRIMGEVKEDSLEILRQADVILRDELKATGWYNKTWQAFCVLLNVNSVGVMGDNRTYENAVCIRIVDASDGMTANFSHLPYEILENISKRIINEVEGINRVVYDISSKPPATIEWE